MESLLLAEPDNEEYAGIHESLQEVIDLTRSLLQEARQNAAAAGGSLACSALCLQQARSDPSAYHAGPSSRPQAVVTTAPQLQLPARVHPDQMMTLRTVVQLELGGSGVYRQHCRPAMMLAQQGTS